jgi:type I restriction enzyme S subunit
MYGATIGRLGVLGIKATTNQACCVMTDSPSIKNPYLYYWLMGYRDEIIKLGYGGGQPNISQDTISSLQVSAPSIKLQEKIINYLDDKTSKIDKLISKSTKAIDLLKEKRTALISSTVTGKIDVREVA